MKESNKSSIEKGKDPAKMKKIHPGIDRRRLVWLLCTGPVSMGCWSVEHFQEEGFVAAEKAGGCEDAGERTGGFFKGSFLMAWNGAYVIMIELYIYLYAYINIHRYLEYIECQYIDILLYKVNEYKE